MFSKNMEFVSIIHSYFTILANHIMIRATKKSNRQPNPSLSSALSFPTVLLFPPAGTFADPAAGLFVDCTELFTAFLLCCVSARLFPPAGTFADPAAGLFVACTELFTALLLCCVSARFCLIEPSLQDSSNVSSTSLASLSSTGNSTNSLTSSRSLITKSLLDTFP